jgi:hypothetical protein
MTHEQFTGVIFAEEPSITVRTDVQLAYWRSGHGNNTVDLQYKPARRREDPTKTQRPTLRALHGVVVAGVRFRDRRTRDRDRDAALTILRKAGAHAPVRARRISPFQAALSIACCAASCRSFVAIRPGRPRAAFMGRTGTKRPPGRLSRCRFKEAHTRRPAQ